MPIIQLALDMTDIEVAIDIVSKVLSNIDYIEAGTPLIKSVGKSAIQKLKSSFPEKILIADMKTIDTGARDCRIAFEAGADGIIVQAFAPIETLKVVAKITKDQNKILMLDSLGMNDICILNNLVTEIKPDYTIIHIGIDEQPSRDLSILFDIANNAITYDNLSSLALAGGIGSQMLSKVKKIPSNVKIIIVGDSITSSVSAFEESLKIKNKLKSFF